MNADEYIDKLDSPLKEICKKLQSIVLTLSSEIKETIKWGVPTYSIGKNVCSIMAHKRHVNFQIFQGAHIEDAQDLVGTGKDMRHLKFSTVDEVEETWIRKYLEQAVAVDSDCT